MLLSYGTAFHVTQLLARRVTIESVYSKADFSTKDLLIFQIN